VDRIVEGPARPSMLEDPRTVLTTTPTGLAGWAREHLLPLL
jgi:hypothetical protein